MQGLVLLAGRIALLDPLVGPALPLLLTGPRRPPVLDSVLGPLHGEAGVEHAAGIERGLGRVDQRDRGDRGQAGRVGLRGEELADPAVGDPHHPDLVVQRPRLAGNRLDHVVAVQALEWLEEVERTARAPRAAHVHVDHGEAHQVADDRDPALRPVGVRVAVAAVLDQHRRRALRHRRQQGADRQSLGHVLRGMDVVGELGAIARGQVAVAAGRDLLVVDVGTRRRRPRREHLQRTRPLASAANPDPVARPWLDLPEQDRPLRVRPLGPDRAAALVEEEVLHARLQAGRVHLLHTALRVDGRLGHARAGPEQAGDRGAERE